jgi:hypothetical protein
LALENSIDGRDRLHLELAGDKTIRVDIDLRQHDALVGIIGGDLFQHRRQLFARAAPFGPEIQDDQIGHRRFDDIAAKSLDGFLFLRVQTQRGHEIMLLFEWLWLLMWELPRICQPFARDRTGKA